MAISFDPCVSVLVQVLNSENTELEIAIVLKGPERQYYGPTRARKYMKTGEE